MNIVVVGLGSMGRRRIRLLQRYDSSMNIIGVDLQEVRCRQAENECGIRTSNNLQDVIKRENVECAIITTSPISHGEIIYKCLSHDLHVFTEINLVEDMYKENIQLAKERGKVLFLSSTFLYRKEVEYITKEMKKQNKQVRYQYHVGQYLPDWHPWEDYRNFFVSNKKTNGCREIFAIDLPWLIHVFGDVLEFVVKKSKVSELDIDYPDNYYVFLKHASGHEGVLTVDIVSRKAERRMEIVGENIHIEWDGTPKGLYVMNFDNKELESVLLYDAIDKLSNYSSNIIENAYFEEICEFFDVINSQKMPRHSFEKDLSILELINKFEE